MVPIVNCPLLEHVLEAAREAGLDEFVFVVGYKRERIQDYFGNGDDWNVEIEYAIQETQLGTGHALLQAESLIDGAFLALNGDRIVAPHAISAILDEQRATDEFVLAVRRHDTPQKYGVVDFSERTVRSIDEKPPAQAISSDYINAGIYGLTEDIFADLRAAETNGELAITAALCDSDARLRAVPYEGLWLDMSHYWNVLTVNSQMLDRRPSEQQPRETAIINEGAVVAGQSALGTDSRLRPGAVVHAGSALGDNVEIGTNAVVANTVILSDTSVGDGTVLHDTIVGEKTTIGPNVTIEGGETKMVVNDDVYGGVRLGAAIGDNCSVGGGVTIEPGTVLGNHVTVESGCTVRGRVEHGAVVQRG
jgi:glucose-1-phosphate thymidylyltransferase